MTLMQEELKTFAEAEVCCYVATRNAALEPEAGFGWGPRLIAENEIEIFVDHEASVKTLANLRENRQIAITIGSPITHRAVQVKGWCAGISEPAAEDAAWLDRHRTMVTEAMRARGLPAQVTRTWWSRDVVKLHCMIEARFDQTPGPGAGARL